MAGKSKAGLHFLYASDERFAEVLAVSLDSLLDHHKHIKTCHVYIFNNGMSNDSLGKLQKLADGYGRTLHILPMEDMKCFTGVEVSCQSKITLTAYYRLFAAKLLPDVDRLIYLDCDTLVCDALDKLYEVELMYTCGAVAEKWSGHMLKLLELDKAGEMFNSGMLLIDLKAWREQDMYRRFVDYIGSNHGRIFFEDQGVLNAVLRNQIDILPARYNVITCYFEFGIVGSRISYGGTLPYGEEEIKEAMIHPAIVHFTNCYTCARPWVTGSTHPYADEWLRRKRNTPWRNAPLWPDRKDRKREMCRCIYHNLPGNLKYWFTYVTSGIIRPMLWK